MAAPRMTSPRRGGAGQRAPSTQPRPGSRRRYQRLAAGSLIAAPLVLLAGGLLPPPFQRDPARQLAVVAANPDRWYLAHPLGLIGFALLVPAILGLTQLVGQRRAARPGVLPLYLVSLASAVGLLVLTVGLYRSQLIPAWTAGLVAIGVAVWFTGEAAASKATMGAGGTMLALGLGLTGRRLLTASTQQPPQSSTVDPTPNAMTQGSRHGRRSLDDSGTRIVRRPAARPSRKGGNHHDHTNPDRPYFPSGGRPVTDAGRPGQGAAAPAH